MGGPKPPSFCLHISKHCSSDAECVCVRGFADPPLLLVVRGIHRDSNVGGGGGGCFSCFYEITHSIAAICNDLCIGVQTVGAKDWGGGGGGGGFSSLIPHSVYALVTNTGCTGKEQGTSC